MNRSGGGPNFAGNMGFSLLLPANIGDTVMSDFLALRRYNLIVPGANLAIKLRYPVNASPAVCSRRGFPLFHRFQGLSAGRE